MPRWASGSCYFYLSTFFGQGDDYRFPENPGCTCQRGVSPCRGSDDSQLSIRRGRIPPPSLTTQPSEPQPIIIHARAVFMDDDKIYIIDYNNTLIAWNESLDVVQI